MTRIGILGGGQLAAMLIGAAQGMPSIEISLFCESDDEATRHHKDRKIASLKDIAQFTEWAKGLDFITFEHEHVDLAPLNANSEIRDKFRPLNSCVAVAQDREFEKRAFERLDIPVAPWCELSQLSKESINEFLPGIVKTAMHGYDGKGQISVRSIEDIKQAGITLSGHRCIIEKRIEFVREVSQVSVRSADGQMLHYPLVENTHRSGILSVTKVGTQADAADLSTAARRYTEQLARDLNYVGTIAVEFFVIGSGLIANEWAPRVHNSGHWTIEGAKTSQFENHLRAVAGLPLGSCSAIQPTTMWNVIGVERKVAEAVVERVLTLHPSTPIFFHWYGKSPRPGRKVGHITVCEIATSSANVEMASLVEELQSI